MIRVLHVVVAGAVGGAERVLADLATHPEETGATHAAAVIAPDPRIAGFLTAAGVAFEERRRLPEGPLADLVVSLGRGALDFLIGCARSFGASVLHLHTFGSHLLGARAARALDLPFVRTEHSARVYRDLSCWPATRGSLAGAAAVVAVCDYVWRVAAR
jgi:L-malate glycosyltransferase